MTASRRSPRAAATALATVVMALATARAAADPDPADGPDADAHITLVPDPAVLAPGAHESSIQIVLSGPGPAVAAAPRLFVNVGHVEEPRRTGDRSFVTRFHAPEVHFPQIAIIAAEAGTAVTPVKDAALATKSLARGFSTVALRAAAQPSFRTEAGARVTVRVGGEEFGPVIAGDDGQARIPIVVSPGAPIAHVRAIDQRGRISERDVDLKPPRFPQLLLLAPITLPAGGTVELGLIGIAADGTPIDDRRLVLRSSYLRPHPLGPVDHVARYLVRVPPRIEAGPLRLTARLRADPAPDGEERDDLDLLEASLPLRPGPLARLTLAPHQSRLTVSGDDPWGQPVPIEGVEIYVNGQPAQLEPQGPERAIVVFDPGLPSSPGSPRAARASRLGPGPVEIEAVLEGVYARYQLPRGAITGAGATLALPAGPPSETIAITAAMGMLWPRGPGFGVEARADLDGRPDWLPRRLHLGAGVVYLGSRGSASDDLGQSAISIDQVLLLGRAGGRMAVGRRIECALSVGAGIAYSQVRNQVYRLRLTDRQAGPAAELGVEAGAALGRGAIVLASRYLRVPLDTLSRGDVIRGTGGGLVFDLGYRLRF
jgi:hypothetical protein